MPPAAIVAFTFTERAARSLKARVEKRVAAKLGRDFLNTLNGMFIGTIHSYGLRLLQLYVPRYETFDVLDDHQLIAFLSREHDRLGLRDLASQHFAAIAAFAKNVEVVENEPTSFG